MLFTDTAGVIFLRKGSKKGLQVSGIVKIVIKDIRLWKRQFLPFYILCIYTRMRIIVQGADILVSTGIHVNCNGTYRKQPSTYIIYLL